MPKLLSVNLKETVFNAEQPAGGTNVDYALPSRANYLGVSLEFPGTAPAAIALNIQGGNADGEWVTVQTLNSVAANSQVICDMRSFSQVRFNVQTHTTPQNIIVTCIPRV